MPVPLNSMMAQPAIAIFERLQIARPARTGIPKGRVSNQVKPTNYPAYIDRIFLAIFHAWTTWQSSAALVGVRINGIMASGGNVVGPPWFQLIGMDGPKDNAEVIDLTQAIAQALGIAWLQFTGSISVPNMPWYPTFAAVPSPAAPPTPNIPVPVAALKMTSGLLSANVLANAMSSPVSSQLHRNLFEAIATAFEDAVNFWKTTTMVMNVMGTGPVPTFAPPYVPIGPVVGGVGNMTPGGFR